MYKNFILTESERKEILKQHKNHGYKKPLNENYRRQRVEFANGSTVSIQANSFAYCQPQNNEGPYEEVELGYPSDNCILPKLLLKYQENSNYGGMDDYGTPVESEMSKPEDSVFPYVPANIVKKLIRLNGGVVGGDVPPLV